MRTKTTRRAMTTPITEDIDTGSAKEAAVKIRSQITRFQSKFSGSFGLTFDHEGDRVAVGAVGVLHVEVVALRVHRVDLLDEEAGHVAVLALGVLHDLLGQVLAQELLG